MEYHLERYSPQHPLPESIQKMEVSETVCHYCGMSYLIHREIKALEDKILRLELELKKCRDAEQREKELISRVNSLQQSLEEVQQQKETLHNASTLNEAQLQSRNKELKESRTHLKRLEADIDDLNKEISLLSSANNGYKNENSQTKSKLKTIVKCLQSLKTEFVNISDIAEENKKYANQKVKEFRSYHQQIIAAHQTDLQQMKLKNVSLGKENNELLKLKENYLKIEKDSHVFKRNAYLADQKLKNLENANQLNKQRIRELEDKLENYQEINHQSVMESNQYKDQLKNMKNMVEELNCQLRKKEQHMENLLQNSQIEVHELQQKLHAVRRECNQVHEQLNTKQTDDNEVKRKQQVMSTLVEQLRDSEKKLRSEIESLKKERDTTTSAHQDQILQLKNSFRQKLEEFEKSPLKLETLLQKERNNHILEIEKLKEEMSESFHMSLEIEKQKYQKLLDKYQEDKLNAEEIAKKQVASAVQCHIEAINDLEELLSSTRNTFTENEISLKKEIDGLKKVIKDLEKRIANSDKAGEEETTKLNLELAGKQQELKDFESKLKTCNQQLEEANCQILNLQKTVHDECKERLELTESLTAARTELLQLKKPFGGYNKIAGKTERPMLSSEDIKNPPLTTQSDSHLLHKKLDLQNFHNPQPMPRTADNLTTLSEPPRKPSNVQNKGKVAFSNPRLTTTKPTRDNQLYRRSISEDRRRFLALLSKNP
ncbi:leucine-, glutamate- and lysine-rich protein 1-like [Octopus sinensis]|uniref:Leucine-, glutamate- and lysine-rich protein 1-like n=1 Tax=Octopus sinensis TaxID=2607531 RepID=A0A6P7TEP7_9MOLL|nr:leucine-, glutamate- and lysine-rich protein 1-like [Octopus sinensis]